MENQTFNGRKFVGFKSLGFLNSGSSKKQGPPESWCQHTFTEDELDALEAGSEIYVHGLVSKNNNVFSAYLKYGVTDKGTKGIIMRFEDRK